MASGTLIISCGALAREIKVLTGAGNRLGIAVHCLPAELHNHPERIPQAVGKVIHDAGDRFQKIFVAYGDCGTGGALDAVLREEGVERISGNHCYEFFAGSDLFMSLSEEEVGTFYLTDFLVRHFDRLVWQGLGIAAKPELLPLYFGNYRRLLYLAQTRDETLQAAALEAAQRLGLEYHYLYTGYGLLEGAIGRISPALRTLDAE
ncbi:MAG: DUF1638 domain-containing protein [Sedimenticola sp.]